MRKEVLALFAISITCTVAVAQKKTETQTVYKWTESGQVHYGFYVPNNVLNYEIIAGKKKSLAEVAPNPNALPVVEEAKKSENLGEIDEIKKKNCEISKANLGALNQGPVFEKKVDGTISELSMEDKKARVPQVMKDIDYYCN